MPDRLFFGIPAEIKPMRVPFEYSKLRYRFRNHDFAYVYFKTADGIRKFPIEEDADGWTVDLKMEQGRNLRNVSSKTPEQ